MRFGYFIGQDVMPGDDPAQIVREALAEAQAAEEAGFDGVFVSEHHGVAAGYLPASLPLMYLLAQATERVDVGAAVLLLSLAQPTRVAEEVALLDHVSGGRVVLGLGAGYLDADFAAFDVPRARAGARMEEALEVMRALWSGGEVDHDGEFHRLRGASTFPPPLTPGGPPVWIGGRSVPGVRRAARVGQAWLLDATPTRTLFRRWHARYVKECRTVGTTPRTAVLRDAWLDLGGPEDRTYRETTLASHRMKMAAGVYAVDPEMADRRPEDVRFDDLARDRWLTGGVERVRAELEAWERELGVDYVLLRIRARGTPSHEVALEQIRAFGEQLIGRTRLEVT